MRLTAEAILLGCLSSCSMSVAFTTQTFPLRSNAGPPHTLHSKIDSIDEHPAVLGWPVKYAEAGGSSLENGPRVISSEFDVHPASVSEMVDLDVKHWPTWTTGDKPKWDVGNKVTDKEMPYGELSYMISGKLEITPESTGVPVVVKEGDLVTFPKGFVASWEVLEELTWHYYLY